MRALPSAEPFASHAFVPRADGMSGIHGSRRSGEGGELAGVRPYRPGDRLRRIDWRTTLRTREPYVNATRPERDAEIVLLLDVLHEAGGDDGTASVLDATVRAAAAIAEHYTRQGDRVSLTELGPRLRRLRPGTGAALPGPARLAGRHQGHARRLGRARRPPAARRLDLPRTP
ncbi:DUF58 domain-containing protein [Streptosporangium lutulentum]